MTMEKHPFEDVFPIKHADLPLPSLFFWEYLFQGLLGY